jgi:DNA-binding response OmpR family regulator
MVMPRMDGYEMFRALQDNSTTRNIPVIALTSKAAAEEEAKLLERGYFDFIAKPINPVRVAARARRALRVTCCESGEPRRQCKS